MECRLLPQKTPVVRLVLRMWTRAHNYLPLLQTCVDILTFRDATCQYQIIAAVDATVFAMGLTANVDKLLAELQQHAGALAAAATADTPKDET